MRAGGRPEAEPLWATERNPARETKGGRVAAVSARMGRTFMPHQRLIADVAKEIDPVTGDPWYREIVIVIERQAGKTTYVRADLTDRALYKRNALLRYTAQTRGMALERLERDFWTPINESPLRSFLDAKVGRRTGKPGLSGKNGSERIQFVNGSQLGIDSVKSTSGHGPTLDAGAIDEAFAQPDWRVDQAMSPAMITVPDAQLIVASAAGDASSHYLREKSAAARARLELELTRPLHRRTSRTAYFEYAVAPGEDPDDPATWWHRHPALGYTITEAALHAEQEKYEANPDEFYRAYCGIWPAAKLPDPVVPRASWSAIKLDEAEIDWRDEPVWGLDVSPDRDWTSVGMAARHPGRRAYVEVLDHEQGTHWAVRRLVQLRQRFGGDVVAIDGASGAGALERDLENEGFTVSRLNVTQKADACGGWYDDVLAGLLAHPDDPVLNAALFSAVKHRVADRWVFSRGRSLQDITPLYAVLLARFALAERMADDYDVDASTYGGAGVD